MEPLYERRDFNVVMIDIAQRLGIHGAYFKGLNDSIPVRYGGEMDPKYKLKEDGSEEYTWEEVTDRLLKDRFGEEHGLEEVRSAPQGEQDPGTVLEAAAAAGRIVGILADLPGIKPQPKAELSRFKLSYYIDPALAPGMDEIHSLLRQADLSVNAFLSFGQYLDIVPMRASKGFALRWFADQWDIPLEHILAAGGSGTDEDMLRGNTLAVVVANRHEEELSHMTETESIYFASKGYARGILEAIDHYDFFASCSVPTDSTGSS